MKKIKLLIVDDSILFRHMIAKKLDIYQDIEIVATAKDSYDARDKIIKYNPDVLTLDIEMPGIDGLKFLQILKKEKPIPTIIMSGANEKCFEAMNLGAIEFISKPNSKEIESFIVDLVNKIRQASQVNIKRSTKTQKDVAVTNKLPDKMINKSFNQNTLIAIGASMGGVEAVEKILKKMPLGLPGIVITQHMPAKFTQKYAQRLNKQCEITVNEAVDGQEIIKSNAYIAPGNFQMSVENKKGRYFIKIKKGDKVSGHCPSVDYLFDSVAKEVKDNSIGVILTGMGSDGAKGLLNIKKSGGYTIGQNKESCVVYGMPMVAKKIGAVQREASLEFIPNIIINRLILMNKNI